MSELFIFDVPRAPVISSVRHAWHNQESFGLRNKARKESATLSDTINARSNNSLNPSRFSLIFIRQAWMPDTILPAGLIRALGIRSQHTGIRMEFKKERPKWWDEGPQLTFADSVTILCEAYLLMFTSANWTPAIYKSDPAYNIAQEAIDVMRLRKVFIDDAPSKTFLALEHDRIMRTIYSNPTTWLNRVGGLDESSHLVAQEDARRIGPHTSQLIQIIVKAARMLAQAIYEGTDPNDIKRELANAIELKLISATYLEAVYFIDQSTGQKLITLPEPSVVIATNWEDIISRITQNSEILYNLDWKRFEDLIAHLLQEFGWSVEPMGYTKDGGMDIIAVRKVEPDIDFRMMVQCKRIAFDRRVGVQVVRELWAVKWEHAFHHAMLATTSYFTRGAVEKAQLWNLELKDHQAIVNWCQLYGSQKDA